MILFSKIFQFVKALFTPTVQVITTSPTDTTTVITTTPTPADIAVQDLEHAIVIVNNIRKAMASPIAVLITALIPGTIDDVIREELVQNLPLVVQGLTFVDNALKTSDKSALLNDVLSKIKFSDKPAQDAFLHSLASRVLMIVSGGKISWSNAVVAVEYYFKHVFGIDNTPAATVVAVPVATEPVVASINA